MQISRNFLSAVVASAVVLGLSSASRAQVPFPTFSTTGALLGNQAHGGPLGTFFSITGPAGLTIRDIGVFDSLADGFQLGTTLQVAIFTQAGVQVTNTLQTFDSTSQGTLDAGSYRFKALPNGDVHLAPGSYAVVAHGFNASDMNYNSGGFPSSINVGEFAFQGNNIVWGSAFYDNGPLQLPTIPGGATDRFGAGVFTVMIPEPGTFALLGLGLASIALAIRRRRK
ncbi:PEP-CTERM sorting domain-containing protein [Armatimonas sp.]|uniref:PEP-CTERM sorting domain-containing protein n=1 Tax=Armatimonas sp. TaxID=1872638 RepID=UPI0037530388